MDSLESGLHGLGTQPWNLLPVFPMGRASRTLKVFRLVLAGLSRYHFIDVSVGELSSVGPRMRVTE